MKPKETMEIIGDIPYVLTRKSVKNIILHVGSDGLVAVSANHRVPIEDINAFVVDHAQWIASAQEKIYNRPEPSQPATQSQRRAMAQEFLPVAMELAKKFYWNFRPYHIPLPEVRVRYMKSRWGSCYTTRNIIVLNTRLLYYPIEYAEFVVTHEFCHFIHPNHSKDFYDLMDEIMPDWRERKGKFS